jgi:hypothetical protein
MRGAMLLQVCWALPPVRAAESGGSSRAVAARSSSACLLLSFQLAVLHLHEGAATGLPDSAPSPAAHRVCGAAGSHQDKCIGRPGQKHVHILHDSPLAVSALSAGRWCAARVGVPPVPRDMIATHSLLGADSPAS